MSKINIGSMAVRVVCGLVAGLWLSGCSTTGKQKVPPVTVGQIVEMSKAGTPTVDIIAKIRESGTVYRMKASDLAKLKEQGVSDDVIDYMQKTYLHAVERDQRLEDSAHWTRWDDGYWYGGLPFVWPYEPYWYGPDVIIVPERVHERHDVDRRPASRPSGDGHRRDAR